MAPALSTPHPLVNPDQTILTEEGTPPFSDTRFVQKKHHPQISQLHKKPHHRQRNILQFRLI